MAERRRRAPRPEERGRLTGLRGRVSPALRRAGQWLRTLPGAAWLAALVARITPTGRIVLGWGAVALVAGWFLGWVEVLVMGVMAVVAVAVGLLLSLGRSALTGVIEVSPPRVTVGVTAGGRIVVRNPGTRPSLPARVSLRVARGGAAFAVPGLGAGDEREELFVVPTSRRGVIDVGPLSAVRGDPLGLVRREAVLARAVPLYVHPRTVMLENAGTGFLRDLEGRATKDLSNSDIAFHTLRDYVPGDDRRFVHWRTSARTGKLMVRQFIDTRRSHVAVLLDGEARHYRDDDDFELAVSVAASLALRAMRDGLDLTVVAGGVAMATTTSAVVLDGFCRPQRGDRRADLAAATRTCLTRAGDVSTALLVTGGRAAPADLRNAASRLPADVTVLAVQCERGRTAAAQQVAGMAVLAVDELDGLARVLRVGVPA